MAEKPILTEWMLQDITHPQRVEEVQKRVGRPPTPEEAHIAFRIKHGFYKYPFESKPPAEDYYDEGKLDPDAVGILLGNSDNRLSR